MPPQSLYQKLDQIEARYNELTARFHRPKCSAIPRVFRSSPKRTLISLKW